MPVFLSYVWLLVCALILAIIGVIISFLGEKSCLSKQCIGQAKFIYRSMNKRLDPCDNFYSFVCNNFDQYGSSIFDEVELKQLKRLVRYISVPASWEDDDRIEHIAKTLYQNCINDTQLKAEGIKPLYRITKRLGSIPFLDPDWDYESKGKLDIFDIESKHFFNGLHSIFVYNRVIKLKSYPTLNPKNESMEDKVKSMYFAYSIPPHLYNAVAPDPENYLRYCIEFNNLFRESIGTNKKITIKEKNEIKEAAKFKSKLLSIIDKTKNCSEQPFIITKLNDLENLGTISLDTYINRKAQPGTPKEDYIVITPKFQKYIVDLTKLIESVPARVMANYMGIEGLIQMTPFLPVQYREIYDQYLKSESDQHNIVLKDRHIHCAKLVKDAMTTALTSQFLKEFPHPPEGISLLNSLVYQLSMQVQGILEHIKWAGKRDHSRMLRLANRINIVSPLPPDVMEMLQVNAELELFYLISCMNEESTLESYLSVKVVRTLRNAQILNDDGSSQFIPLSVFHEDYDIFDTEIYYHQDSNSIVVPMAYLFYPALDSWWPKYLNFGGLAVWIAHMIIKIVGYNNVLFPELKPEDTEINQEWWQKETVSRYENKRECALKEYNEYLKPFGVKSNDANCLEDTLYNAAAVQAAFLAYQENTRTRFFVEARIPYLTRYNVEKIFFIKFASSFCQYGGKGKRYAKDSDTSKVSSNFTLLYSLRNFRKFHEVFRCEKNDKMYKEEPCEMWLPIKNE